MMNDTHRLHRLNRLNRMTPVSTAAAAVLALLFAMRADARGSAEPTEPVVASSVFASLAVGVVATAAQLGSYGVCFLMIGKEDTCLTVADRALRVVTSVR